MIDHKRLPQWLRFGRAALAAGLALTAAVVPFTATAATSVTLMAEAADTLPGFHLADLSRYLALHMRTAWPRAHTGEKSGLFPGTKAKSGERRTLCWRGMDSNFQYAIWSVVVSDSRRQHKTGSHPGSERQ